MRKILILLIGVICFCCSGEILAGTKTNKALALSIEEAILLAVRDNPNVQSSRLSYTAQKFSLWVQRWEFLPHYTFQASVGSALETAPDYKVQAGISLLTPVGTQAALSTVNPNSNDLGLSFAVMQPLMRGFGKPVVEAALNNAKDSEAISRLSVEGVLRNTITSIINAYLDVVTAEKSILIDEGALKRARKSVEQTKLFIKAGHLAGNQLVTVEANVATARSRLENDKNNLIRARFALFAAIGIDPNANVKFNKLDLDKLIKKYHSVSLSDAKYLVLENDIQYQIDQITLNGPTARSLLIAEDNTRWELNLTGNVSTGAGLEGGLALQIPIDDQTRKQAVVNAKIALKQAGLALKQEKWSKETNAINGWSSVLSAKQTLKFASDAEGLQEKTYNLSYQKYLHGLIDSLELQTALVSLIQSQQSTLNARIGYIKALVNMDLLVGNTLNTWDVKVRLS